MIIVIPGFALVLAIIGAMIASKKNKNVALWFIICAAFPVVGLLAIAFIGASPSVEQRIAAVIKGGYAAPEAAAYVGANNDIADDALSGEAKLALLFLAIISWRVLVIAAFGV